MSSLSLHKTSSGGQEIHLLTSSQLSTQLLFLSSLILTLTPVSFLCGHPVPLPLSFILPHSRREGGGVLWEPFNWAEQRNKGQIDSRKFLGSQAS